MRRIKYLFFVFVIACSVMACQKEEENVIDFTLQEEEKIEETKQVSGTICVYVCGAVVKEGVYELPEGSRVYEVLDMAGGFREDAATTEVNQAEILEDAMKLYIPTIEEIQKQQSQGNRKVDLNLASKEELMTLPGVGESKAESIIRYREEKGRFQKIEDIMEISGIKEGLYEKIKDFIQV